MINFLSTLIYITTVYAISLPTGYLVFHRIFGLKLFSYPLFIRLPIYIAFGIIILTPIYVIVSFIKVTILTILIIFLFSIGYLIWIKRFCFVHDNEYLQKQSNHYENIIDKILPLILFISTSLYIILIVNLMKWPPAGDIITGIGPLVSLIEFSGKLPIEPSPILILYPPGFHVLTATFNTIMKLYPAEAVFLMGASVVILIPLLLYSLTYFITHSKLFSVIGFFSSLLIPPSGRLVRWIVGYLFNGPYACLTGYLIIITFINLLVLLNTNNIDSYYYDIKKPILISIFVTISLTLIYPPFAILTIIYSIIIVFMHRNSIFKQHKLIFINIKKNISMKILLIVVILIVSYFFSLILVNSYFINIFISYLRGAYYPEGQGIGGVDTKYAPVVPQSFFFNNVNGFSILIAIPIAAYFIIKLKRIDVSIFFIIIFILIFISFNKRLYEFSFYILPSRSIIILSLLSFPLILMASDQIIKKIASFSIGIVIINAIIHTFKRKIVIKPLVIIPKIMIVIIVSSIFIPSLYGYLSLQQLKSWSWFSKMPSFEDDFAALEWIDKNVEPYDLILNDASYASMYLWSLSIKNITHHLWTRQVYEERFNDAQKVWENPRDIEYIISVFRKYNVRYVLSTSEWGYQMYGKPFWYKHKPYTPENYAKIFDNYNFLELVFKSGLTRVYKVISYEID